MVPGDFYYGRCWLFLFREPELRSFALSSSHQGDSSVTVIDDIYAMHRGAQSRAGPLVDFAVVRPGDDAYGMTVRQELEERTGRDVSLGAVYATLDRFANKGYLESSKHKSGAERRGRANRIFRVEPSGLAALRNTFECVERMREGYFD